MDRRGAAALCVLLLTVPTLVSASVAPASEGGGPAMEVIVQFHGEVREEDLALLRGLGFAGGHIYSSVPAVWTRGPAGSVDLLSKSERVRSVEPNRPVLLALDSSRKALGAEASAVSPGALEDLGLTGEGVTVALVDTGIDATHPDLPYGRKVVANVKVVQPVLEGVTGFSRDAVSVASAPDTDDNGHGTHVAGVACGSGAASGGRFAGVAPGCSLVGVGVGVSGTVAPGEDGQVFLGSMALAGFGLDWVHRHHEALGIDVVSNSWSAARGAAYEPGGFVESLVRALHDEGVLVVFAAGNFGPSADTLNAYAESPYALAVGNYDDRTGLLAPSSSRGAPGSDRAPDVSAPGTAVVAPRSASAGRPALSDYVALTGTSVSAPHAAGAAALLLEAAPGLSPGEVMALLRDTADPLRVRVADGETVRAAERHEQGWGALDAYAAAARATGRGVVAITAPSGGAGEAVVTGDHLTVTGRAASVAAPERPGHWPLAGSVWALPEGAEAVERPPVVDDEPPREVAAGSAATLTAFEVGAGHPDFRLTATTPARFRVTPEGAPDSEGVVVPAEPLHRADGLGLFTVRAPWQPPTDQAPGSYTVRLEARAGPGGEWVSGPSAPLRVVGPAGAAAAPAPGGEGLEDGAEGHAVVNHGTGAGALTTWRLVEGDGVGVVPGPRSGDRAWYAGVAPTAEAWGAAYTDGADASLILPAFDLQLAAEARLTYHLAGATEPGRDVISVEARRPVPGAPWTPVATHSGYQFEWAVHEANLTPWAGGAVEVRFRFTSDEVYADGVGWLLDDVAVAVEPLENAPPTASLEARVDGTVATFAISGSDADGAVDGWRLEFGDGEHAAGAALPANVTHDYGLQGDHVATLTVWDDGGASAVAEAPVSTVVGVQVRVGGGDWVDAVDVSPDGDWSAWSAALNLSHLADGHHAVEARFPRPGGGYARAEAPFLLARRPWVTAQEALAPVGAPVNLSVEAVGASGAYDAAWDLDGDGAFDDAAGLTAVGATFASAGDAVARVRVVDAADALLSTVAEVPVAVYEPVRFMERAGQFEAGVPDEAVTAAVSMYPEVSPESRTYHVNVRRLAEDVGGRVVGLDFRLTWGVHEAGGRANDLDLYVVTPSGALDRQGATLGPVETASFRGATDSVWRAYVEPVTVVVPDRFELTVDALVVPG